MDTFSTENVPVNQRLDFWRELVCGHLLDLHANLKTPKNSRFYGRITLRDLQRIKLMKVVSPKNLVTRDSCRVKKATEEFVLLLFQLSGTSTFEQAGRTVTLTPGIFTLYDSLLPHQLDVGNDYEGMVLRIPRQHFIHSLPRIQNVTALPLNGNAGMGRIVTQLVEMLSADVDKANSDTIWHMSDALFNSIAAAVNAAYPQDKARVSSSKAALLQRVKIYIDQNLAEDFLTPSHVAAIHNISGRYLNKLFEQEDTSVTRRIRRRRLEKCAVEFASPSHTHLSIGEIAYSWGFNNLSYFSREFKLLYECTPYEYRHICHPVASTQAK